MSIMLKISDVRDALNKPGFDAISYGREMGLTPDLVAAVIKVADDASFDNDTIIRIIIC